MLPDIFDCRWCDDDGDGFTIYIECELNQAIGPYEAGAEVAVISINYEDGTIMVYDNEADVAPTWTGKINYTFSEVGVQE